MVTCKNCGTIITGKFCSECGQKAEVERLTIRVIAKEILHFITHMEKGFLQTTRDFVIRPGTISLNYLEGKRKNYQKPVSMFVIYTGFYILIHNFIINHYHYKSDAPAGLNSLSDQANILLRNNFTPFFLPVMFLSAAAAYFILGKPRFNFTEIIVLSLYGSGIYFMMLIISDIMLGAVFHTNINILPVFIWQMILAGSYNFWFTYDLYKGIRLSHLWGRLILTALLISLIGMSILLYLPLAIVYLLK